MAVPGFGNRLRTFRMKRNLSLQALADQVGATKAHIWELEQGKAQNPSLTLLTNLARALDTPIKDLVGESDTTTATDPPALAPLFRELRGLSEEQLEVIRTLTDKVRTLGDGKKSDG